MDEAKIMRALQSMQVKALRAAGQVALTHVIDFVPINNGTLRGTGKVVEEDGFVGVKFGSSKTQDYIGAQYGVFEGGPLKIARNHYISGGKLAPLLDLISGKTRKSKKGKANKKRYAAAYREALDSGKLTRLPNGAQWFNRILYDEEVQRRMWFAYARALRGIA